ncbi:hypothetical protein CC80DRAFT_491267 [Byssothecium circinans]|uniref:Integral membrane protein n=1 Tax=Byssothecium circinans TaxID=147558 RepID=A0A6A5U023_9PLEO|nr:hypothetical protein CC80DRAFT_491267 [Byssothecium circinans]
MKFDSLGHTTIIISWTITALTLFCLAVTTATLLFKKRAFPPSEWLNFAAITIGIVLIAQNTHANLIEGQAKHQSDLSLSRIDILAKSITIHEALWSTVNTLIRISACLALRRIFFIPGEGKRALVVMSISILHGLASILDLALICRPISAQ